MALTLAHAAGPTTPPVRDLTIGDALREVAAAHPDRVALVAGADEPGARREWTYRELLGTAETLARALLSHFEPGERVAVWAPNIAEWVLLEYGCALAGVVLVTLNPSYRASELAYALQQSRAAGLFLVTEVRGNRLADHLAAVRDDCPALREAVDLGELDAFLATADAERELPELSATAACMIQYTSGTTGRPKGALLHHRGLVNNGAHTADAMGMPEGGVYMGNMPLFHTGGCVLGVLGALSKAATLVVTPFEPALVLELMEHYRASAMLGVPTMLIAMVEHPDFPDRDLSSVKAICAGGATVPAELVRRLERDLGAAFTIVFGQTECSPVACMTRPADSIEDKAETLGPPMPNTEAKIVDPGTGETVPVGQLGEFCTRGYHVMLGYFENPEATAETIDDDGWLHTGDLCTMDERGYCRVEGRIKDMIIRGGENVYPREIEELLYRHPDVGEAAVVGVPDDRLGEEIAAFLRPAPGATLDRDALTAYLREHLSAQKTPRHWLAVEEYPLTGSGKIQKFVLRREWEAGTYPSL